MILLDGHSRPLGIVEERWERHKLLPGRKCLKDLQNSTYIHWFIHWSPRSHWFPNTISISTVLICLISGIFMWHSQHLGVRWYFTSFPFTTFCWKCSLETFSLTVAVCLSLSAVGVRVQALGSSFELFLQGRQWWCKGAKSCQLKHVSVGFSLDKWADCLTVSGTRTQATSLYM